MVILEGDCLGVASMHIPGRQPFMILSRQMAFELTRNMKPRKSLNGSTLHGRQWRLQKHHALSNAIIFMQSEHRDTSGWVYRLDVRRLREGSSCGREIDGEVAEKRSSTDEEDYPRLRSSRPWPVDLNSDFEI